MQTTMLSVIPLTLLLFSFGAAVVPPNPDNRLPLLQGNPDRLHGVQEFVEKGYCKKGRDASQCILKGRNLNQNGWEICDTDKPRMGHTPKDAIERWIDNVSTELQSSRLPKEAWKEEYERAGIDAFGRDLSHVDHPHTGEGLLGLGVEVKPLDGNLIEPQVQLAVWMAGLVSWAYSSRHHGSSNVSPPPIVGCTVIGED
ncbi:hypothetical protein BDV24DRAFT_174748 [Aspergillus arachidicola]|uniref:Uncharacterized protein n=1 Tax=Aspergillus arachidicola TaxID=656916 RepID=A0A5N6Y774_9EURO|nr:hypothetical protein BDV24DRAFT_174748 [Aspergillus arachidicola]